MTCDVSSRMLILLLFTVDDTHTVNSTIKYIFHIYCCGGLPKLCLYDGLTVHIPDTVEQHNRISASVVDTATVIT